jgi:3-dehydroquinate synthase
VDSSIGGKTAINHPKGKNLVGSFYQPSLVVSDIDLLRTLPDREVLSGLGEVVKYGVIDDSNLFKYVESNSLKLLKKDLSALTEVVRVCAGIKARLVGIDERDTKDVRAVLNYGHTVGHAIEAMECPDLGHGEAVAFGMYVAAQISERMNLMENEEVERQTNLLKQLGFRLDFDYLDLNMLIDFIRRDKKVEGTSIKFVLPTGMGKQPILKAVSEDLIRQVMGGNFHG